MDKTIIKLQGFEDHCIVSLQFFEINIKKRRDWVAGITMSFSLPQARSAQHSFALAPQIHGNSDFFSVD